MVSSYIKYLKLPATLVNLYDCHGQTNGLAYFAAAKKKVLLDPLQMESLHVLIPSLSRDADLGLMP